MSSTVSLVCSGCGYESPASEDAPYRCPRSLAPGDVDHVLTWKPELTGLSFPGEGDDNPFVRFRELLHSWHVARSHGVSDADYVALVRDLDAAVSAIDHGFVMTPYRASDVLAGELGLQNGLWIKDETQNVSGSHKARHLMGIAIHLEVRARARREVGRRAPLAIASCGNAALAAAVVAKAMRRPLRVFVPTWAHESVLDRLIALGAEIVTCPRRGSGPPGDPCMSRFRQEVDAGALPFTVQGSENGLALDGGRTLAYEMIAQHAAESARPLDRLIVQVGGGALASSCAQGFRIARQLGAVRKLPRLHAVQSEASHPLVRAWETLLRDGQSVDEAAQNRSRYMHPWEEPSHSVASAILDDETYDWLEIVRTMLEGGGWPVAVSEHRLSAALERARAATGIAVDATGSAGLAGLFELREQGRLAADESTAVLFTGLQR